ncbi:ankyrin repeat domain-containing protein [Candidatus Babeliales bacterium]|nr:ankyrin repeat domain-containing protein [Candidatus Babeliales bacterium]
MILNLKNLLFSIITFFGLTPQPITNNAISEETKQFFSSIRYDRLATFSEKLPLLDRNIQLPNGITPITFAIQHSNFACCTELLKQNFIPSVHDLQQAMFMQELETNEQKKEDVKICINFLKNYFENEKASSHTLITRGKDPITLAAQNLALQLNTREYTFMQAIKRNDITSMQTLLEQGVNINAEINGLRPINFAIIHSQEDALRYLLARQDTKVTVTKDDVEQAITEIEMLQAALPPTEQPADLKYMGVKETIKAQNDEHSAVLRKALRVYELVKQRYENDTKNLYVSVYSRLENRSSSPQN